MPERYFEDLVDGERLGCQPVEMTREEIIRFARQYDPQPFHVDEERARESIFGGLVASSLHTLAACTRAVVDAQGGWIKSPPVLLSRGPRPASSNRRWATSEGSILMEGDPSSIHFIGEPIPGLAEAHTYVQYGEDGQVEDVYGPLREHPCLYSDHYWLIRYQVIVAHFNPANETTVAVQPRRGFSPNLSKIQQVPSVAPRRRVEMWRAQLRDQ